MSDRRVGETEADYIVRLNIASGHAPNCAGTPGYKGTCTCGLGDGADARLPPIDVAKPTPLFFAQIPLDHMLVVDVLREAAVKCKEMMQADDAATGKRGEYRVTVFLERTGSTAT
jgi:hypothetical protein